MKTYWTEIHFKGGSVPLIHYGLSKESAFRLCDNAAPQWTVRRIGDSEGNILRNELHHYPLAKPGKSIRDEGN